MTVPPSKFSEAYLRGLSDLANKAVRYNKRTDHRLSEHLKQTMQRNSPKDT